LKAELAQIVRLLPAIPAAAVTCAPFLPYWWHRRQELAACYHDPPLRLILSWDNLAGHKTPALVQWWCHPGILPLYTPLSGSWLNMAEVLPRIIVRRALAGHHPQAAAEIMQWLEETVAGWNADPTPFIWDGQRRERRRRARQRRLGGAVAVVDQFHLFVA
jgi:hypothetical protein